MPAAASAVPGSGAAAGALASGGSEDGVSGQRARRERSGAVVCWGGASAESAPGSRPLPHVVLLLWPGSQGRRCPPRAVRVPGIVPCSFLGLVAWVEDPAPHEGLRPAIPTPTHSGRWAQCWQKRVPVFIRVLCFALTPLPLFFLLHKLQLVAVRGWDPQHLSTRLSSCHWSPTYRCYKSLRSPKCYFASA